MMPLSVGVAPVCFEAEEGVPEAEEGAPLAEEWGLPRFESRVEAWASLRQIPRERSSSVALTGGGVREAVWHELIPDALNLELAPRPCLAPACGVDGHGWRTARPS